MVATAGVRKHLEAQGAVGVSAWLKRGLPIESSAER